MYSKVTRGATRRPMSKHLESESIEPEVLAALAEKAMHEESRLRNPYLRALMVRLGRVALELKAALENEGRLDNGSPRRFDEIATDPPKSPQS